MLTENTLIDGNMNKPNYEGLILVTLKYLGDVWQSKVDKIKLTKNIFRVKNYEDDYWEIGCFINLNNSRYRIVTDLLCGDVLITNGDGEHYINDYSIGYQKRIYKAVFEQIVIPIINLNKIIK